MKQTMLFLILFLAFVPLSLAQTNIVITDAWVREVPPGAQVSAAYLVLENKADQTDKLTAVSSDAAKDVELHNSKVDKDGVATMERVYTLEIPKGEVVELKPGGMHLMLIGLKEPLVGKDSIILNLTFEKSGNVVVEVPVKDLKNSGEHHHH